MASSDRAKARAETQLTVRYFSHRWRLLSLAPVCVAILVVFSRAAVLARAGAAGQGSVEDANSQAHAKQTFVSRCGMCHGIDGRGGEHAPSIATGAATQLSAADLERIVRDGIPSKGMPSFKDFDPATIRSLIVYVRVLQGSDGAAAAKGDPSRGKTLFFGTARCSGCHSIAGEGGFLGPDLSAYSRSHSPARMRQGITDPDREADFKTDTVTVVTRSGERLVGVARNEDNFSLQLQTLDGGFHLLMKAELVTLNHDHRSLMPSDYGARLNNRDLDDLISFLVSAGAASGADSTMENDESDSN